MNQNVCDKFRNISDPIHALFSDSYTVSQRDNRIDAKLGTYKSLYFACSTVCSVTKTLNCFASMRFSVASLRHIALVSYFSYAFHWSCSHESVWKCYIQYIHYGRCFVCLLKIQAETEHTKH